MARFHRIAAAALTSALVLGAPTAASAELLESDNVRNGRSRVASPILLTDRKISWTTGSSGWVQLSWTAKGEVENFQVVAKSPQKDVTVSYPDNTANHTSLMVDDALQTNEIDYTSLYIETGPDTPKNFNVSIEASWTVDGKEYRGRKTLGFRGVAFEGDAFAVMTDSATAVAGGDGSENWLELGYLGQAPSTTGFSVRVEGDVPVYHPQEEFTSLHHDDELLAKETDVARVWFDPDAIEPGTYELTVVVDYQLGSDRRSMKHPVILTVG